ncbi:hypothetical protein KIPB_000506 [Kipferlia bialata]|uniref:Uncharacterized protein n=1 Tax=Kipferlia bialata TaxID=797122 RepID=A0A9K3CP81_9EUKA|nr:hypothetical protein KIPB_000506 [Kipferlia bialata]|eukprot:g506.t1
MCISSDKYSSRHTNPTREQYICLIDGLSPADGSDLCLVNLERLCRETQDPVLAECCLGLCLSEYRHSGSVTTLNDSLDLMITVADIVPGPSPLYADVCISLVSAAGVLAMEPDSWDVLMRVMEPDSWDVLMRIMGTLSHLVERGVRIPRPNTAETASCAQFLIDTGFAQSVSAILAALPKGRESQTKADEVLHSMDDIDAKAENPAEDLLEPEPLEGRVYMGMRFRRTSWVESPHYTKHVHRLYPKVQRAVALLAERVVMAADSFTSESVKALVDTHVKHSFTLQMGGCRLLDPLTLDETHCKMLFDVGVLDSLKECSQITLARTLLSSEWAVENGSLRPGFQPLLAKTLAHSSYRVVGESHSADYFMARASTLRYLKATLMRDSVTTVDALLTGPNSLPNCIYPMLNHIRTGISSNYNCSASGQAVGEAANVLVVLAKKVSRERGGALLRPILEPLSRMYTESPKFRTSSIRILNHTYAYHRPDVSFRCVSTLFNMTLVEEHRPTPTPTCDKDTVSLMVQHARYHGGWERLLVIMPIWRLITLWTGNAANREILSEHTSELKSLPYMSAEDRFKWSTERLSKRGSIPPLSSIYREEMTEDMHKCVSITRSDKTAMRTELHYMGERIDRLQEAEIPVQSVVEPEDDLYEFDLGFDD